MRRVSVHSLPTRLTWLLLVAALCIPATTSALPTDAADIDADAARRADAPSLWDSPAGSGPVVMKPPERPPHASERTPSANPLWAIPLATLSNTRERPIFSSSRRPPPPAVASVSVAKTPAPPPPKPPTVERPQLSLVGTIAGSDESFGIFVDQTTKTAMRLKLGENYQGWKLRSVQGREVTLERDQQTTILSLPQPGTGTVGPVRLRAENAVTSGPAGAPQERGGRR
jgi:hypothetical protein